MKRYARFDQFRALLKKGALAAVFSLSISGFVVGALVAQELKAPKVTDHQAAAPAKPAWLLYAGDEEAKNCGDTVRIGSTLSLPGSEFEFQGYDRADPLTIQWCPNGKVAWVKGKGEIRKIGTGERVVLPLEEDSSSDSQFDHPVGGAVRDARTGLSWQQSDSKIGMNWQGAREYCDQLKPAEGADWRLPTHLELLGLADTAGGEAVTPRTMPWEWTPLAGGAQLMLEGTQDAFSPFEWSGIFYWTSDEYEADGVEHALVVLFAKDEKTWLMGEAKDPASVGRQGYEHFVRCVKVDGSANSRTDDN